MNLECQICIVLQDYLEHLRSMMIYRAGLIKVIFVIVPLTLVLIGIFEDDDLIN